MSWFGTPGTTEGFSDKQVFTVGAAVVGGGIGYLITRTALGALIGATPLVLFMQLGMSWSDSGAMKT